MIDQKLGIQVDEPCSVHDEKQHHCPQPPTHEVRVSGKRLLLCEDCYRNFESGAYTL